MPTSLTATKIKDTYGQVLHVDGGVTSTPKTVYDGDGTATALKVSTTDVQVNNSPVLTDADIGTSVQAYDADLTAWSGKTAPTGAVVGTTDTQTLSSKTFSDNPVLSAGSANGVAYLNGSKVLTTGSALTFDGTKLNVASSADSPVSLFGISNATTGGGSTLNIAAASTQYAFPSVRGDTVLRAESNSLVFGTASEFKWGSTGAEWMRLTSTGLGIGTSSPVSKLTVSGTGGWSANNYGKDLLIYSTGNPTIGLFSADGTSPFAITNESGSLLFSAMPAITDFTTAPNERMRIDSSGNVLVGTKSLIAGSEKVALKFSSNTGPGLVLSDSTIQDGATFAGFYASTTRIGAIVANGTTAVAYNTSSDYRLKENIQPMQNALATVAQLNPVTYKWKADGSDGQGFIAHELQAVVPDCVTGEKDAVDEDGKPVYQGIDTSFLVATLTKAIQELTARVAQLEGN